MVERYFFGMAIGKWRLSFPRNSHKTLFKISSTLIFHTNLHNRASSLNETLLATRGFHAVSGSQILSIAL